MIGLPKAFTICSGLRRFRPVFVIKVSLPQLAAETLIPHGSALGEHANGDRRKVMRLSAETFIGRFLRHVLPNGLMRIRHYGFLANRNRRQKLATIRELLGAKQPAPQESQPQWLTEWLQAILGTEPDRCPCCGDRLVDSFLPNQLASQLPQPEKLDLDAHQERGSPA